VASKFADRTSFNFGYNAVKKPRTGKGKKAKKGGGKSGNAWRPYTGKR
jgi:hypothetical protein